MEIITGINLLRRPVESTGGPSPSTKGQTCYDAKLKDVRIGTREEAPVSTCTDGKAY